MEKLRPNVDVEASCACGAVSLHLKGVVHSMFMCACLDCQKATGSGHSAVAMVRPESVAITGETRTFERPSASGATFTRRFCPNCGTPLTGVSSRAPNALMVSVGLFGANADWYRPGQLIFARSHHDWDVVAADLPQHDTYRGEQ